MAQKDSQDGIERDAEGASATDNPRTEGRPAGGGAVLAASAGEIQIEGPVEILGDEAAPAEDPIEMPANASMEMAGEELPLSEIIESADFPLAEQGPAEAISLERVRDAEDERPHQEQSAEIDRGRVAHLELLAHEEMPAPSLPDSVSGPVAEFMRADADAQGHDAPVATYSEQPIERRAEPAVSASSDASQPYWGEKGTPAPELPRFEPAAPQRPVEADAAATPVTTNFERRKAEALRLLKKGLRYAAYGAAGYLALVLFLILAYRFINPPGSTLMLFQWLGGTTIDRRWVPIERISPNLVRAVIVAEDGRFCDHWGIDIEAIQEAIRRAGDGTPRGASTISMQVTKNLFLWPSKSYLRKIIELPLTLLIELVWPKRRILEIYLNVAEWGPGVFGAEAAAQHHFRRSASRLGEREAALLAASLPNPVRRDAGDPGPRTSSKARVIQARMHVSGPVAACVTGRR